MWRTVWWAHPHWQCGCTPGTRIFANQALKPITSVRIRNSAVACAFESPAYSLRQSCVHGAVQVVGRCGPLYWLAFFSHRAFQSFRARRLSIWASEAWGAFRVRPARVSSAFLYSWILLRVATVSLVLCSFGVGSKFLRILFHTTRAASRVRFATGSPWACSALLAAPRAMWMSIRRGY